MTHALFIDNNETLALGGIDGVSLYKLYYSCHYEPSIAQKIDMLGENIFLQFSHYKNLDQSPNWIRSMQVDLKQNLIMMWS